jgi:hypothetical protein
MPKVNGRAKAILDSEGNPVKGPENRDEAYRIWGETLSRAKAGLARIIHTEGRQNCVNGCKALGNQGFRDYRRATSVRSPRGRKRLPVAR